MDQSLPNQQESQQPEKKGLLKVIALLEVGLFELGFVGIVLILLFGVLNYFNILRLSDLFPYPHLLDESNKGVTMIL